MRMTHEDWGFLSALLLVLAGVKALALVALWLGRDKGRGGWGR